MKNKGLIAAAVMLLVLVCSGDGFARSQRSESCFSAVQIGVCKQFKSPLGSFSTSFIDTDKGVGQATKFDEFTFCVAASALECETKFNERDKELLWTVILEPLEPAKRQAVKAKYKDEEIGPVQLLFIDADLKKVKKTTGYKELWKALLGESGNLQNTLSVVRRRGNLPEIVELQKKGQLDDMGWKPSNSSESDWDITVTMSKEVKEYFKKECKGATDYLNEVYKTDNSRVNIDIQKCADMAGAFTVYVMAGQSIDNAAKTDISRFAGDKNYEIYKNIKAGAECVLPYKDSAFILPLAARMTAYQMIRLNGARDNHFFLDVLLGNCEFVHESGF